MYETEEQRIESIKRWFRDNGRQTIITAVAVLVLFFAGRIYFDNQKQNREAASVKYMELLNAVQDELLGRTGSAEPAPADGAKQESDSLLKRTTAMTLAQEFIEDFPKSAQAPFAAMTLGGYLAQDGELESALLRYEWAIEATSSDLVVQLASLRAARLEIELGNPDKAIRRLTLIESSGELERLRLSVLGDAALADNDQEQARLYYEAAREVKKSDGSDLPADPWLNMRYFDLLTDTRPLSTTVEETGSTPVAGDSLGGQHEADPVSDDAKG